MLEALAVVAFVALLGGAGVVVPLVPAQWFVDAGTQAIALGMLFGVPTGLWYHVRLARSLGRAGRLPSRWWLQPVGLHDQIPPADRGGVLRCFYLGGIGFLLTALGCVGVVMGVLLEGWRAGVF